MTRPQAPRYVAASRARDHLYWLTEDHHVGLTSIAKASGVDLSTLKQILYKRCDDCSITNRVLHETESAILAVRPADALDTERIPAHETWQHINQLLQRGWTKAKIAGYLGQDPHYGLRAGRKYVTRGIARAVHGLVNTAKPAPFEPAEPPAFLPIPPELDLHWLDRARCRNNPDTPTWMFFPGRGDSECLNAALHVCDTCPVRDECLALGLAINAPGIWGGTTELERQRIQGRRTETAAIPA